MEHLKKDYTLVWSDEFDYEGAPNEDKWSYDLGHRWANGEVQAYTNRPSNVNVKDGRLFITALKEKDGDREYTSTRLNTYGKQSFTYGLFEFRVKLPKGKGSWPAIWMLPNSIKEGMSWPKCGEIDIIEHIGRKRDNLFFSLHSQNHNHSRNDVVQYTTFKDFSGVCDEFHDYMMEWTPEYIEFYVDGQSACRYNKSDDKEDQSFDSWPFDQPYYLIMNIAVGGGLGGEVDDTEIPFVMEVDSVKVYQKDV